jgi:hypothetical protein
MTEKYIVARTAVQTSVGTGVCQQDGSPGVCRYRGVSTGRPSRRLLVQGCANRTAVQTSVGTGVRQQDGSPDDCR